MDESVAHALDAIPDGHWGVAVSGGADSTALLVLLRERRPSLPLVALHYNHELRGTESDRDEHFVRRLAETLQLATVVERAGQDAAPGGNTPARRQARYRGLRLRFFARCVASHHLDGVLLGHHRDDQAETVLFRLVRGSGLLGLTGMARDRVVSGVRLLRPLLDVDGQALRDELRRRHIDWCEDSSNQHQQYARNRARGLLRACPELRAAVITLQAHARSLVHWLEANTPTLPPEFPCDLLADLSDLQARFAARRWLRAAGGDVEDINERTCGRLVRMARDAATPACQSFPGVEVLRRGGRIAARAAPR